MTINCNRGSAGKLVKVKFIFNFLKKNNAVNYDGLIKNQKKILKK